MRRAVLALAPLATLLSLAGCSEEPSQAEESGATSVTLTFEDGQAPDPERLAVGVGEEVEVVVKSDTAGSLHVHSTPAKELDYGAGTTTLMFTLEKPGVVDVESHEPATTVLQLEVS